MPRGPGGSAHAGPGLVDSIAIPRPHHRLERLRSWMAEEAVDVCVVAGGQHVTHFCGYDRYYGGASALVIDAEGRRTLAVAFDEVPAARAHSQAEEVVPYGDHGFGIVLDPLPGLTERLAGLGSLRRARRIGIVDALGGIAERLAGSCDAGFVDAGPAVARIRLVRDEDELIKALHSYELSWIAQAAVAEAVQPGVTEIELLTAATSAAQLAHRGPITVLADLPSGVSTALVGSPVHVPGERRVEQSDPVVADFVIGADGYWGDTAETHVVGENAEVAAARTALLEILRACGAELRPGVTGAEVFASMHERVLARFPEGELPHHAGHGVSLTGFEDPHMIPSDHMPLENWMLISLEPGIYFPGRWGSRVENSFVVTPGGGVELRDALGAR
jgi:Xaa-Pro aminopeptidase